MKVYILIPTRNRKKLLEECIKSLQNQTYKDYEIVIIDDGSTDGTKELLQKYNVTILEGDGNLWWTGAMRMGLDYVLSKCGENDYILLQNDDTYMEEDYLENLIKDISMFTRTLLGTEVRDLETKELVYNSHRHTKGTLNPVIIKSDKRLIQTESLSGRGMLIPIGLFNVVKNFSKLFLHYGADYDLACRAANKGFNLFVSTKSITYSTSGRPNLAARIKKQEVLTITDLYQLFFHRRSSNSLWSSTIITLLYAPLGLKFLGVIRIYSYFIKVIIIDWMYKGIKYHLKRVFKK